MLPVKHVKNCAKYDYKCLRESFPRRWQQRGQMLLILIVHYEMPSKQRKTFSSSQDNRPDSVQVSAKAAQIFTALDNSSTYENPVILYGSKILPVPKKSSTISFCSKFLSKTNASGGMPATPENKWHENYTILLASCTCWIPEINLMRSWLHHTLGKLCASSYMLVCRSTYHTNTSNTRYFHNHIIGV